MKTHYLRFRPIIKQAIWGGRRLGVQLGKPIGSQSDYAESWEIVDHGADQSIVINGPLAGKSLSQLVTEHGEWLLGSHLAPNALGQFPLLLKYLDCNRVLSVQVHPDDAYGSKMKKPDRGKTEAWYIVAADEGSVIYAGLKQGVDEPRLREAMLAGQTDEVLHSFQPASGDCVFIPTGTVHALGAGLLVAEIQQSSDTTFRLFDWNRVDEHGNSRPLHIEQSLEVTNYQRGPIRPQRTDGKINGWQTLAECDKFVFRSLEQGTAKIGGDEKFHILTLPCGTATLQSGSELAEFQTGESALIPAAHQEVEVAVMPGSTLLEAHVPD
jgi:mannose-6-phosphate isomerase